MTLSLDIHECTGSAETCPAVRQAFEADIFYEAVGDLDPDSLETRQALGKLVAACVEGKCPGRNPEHARQVLRAMHPPEEA